MIHSQPAHVCGFFRYSGCILACSSRHDNGSHHNFGLTGSYELSDCMSRSNAPRCFTLSPHGDKVPAQVADATGDLAMPRNVNLQLKSWILSIGGSSGRAAEN